MIKIVAALLGSALGFAAVAQTIQGGGGLPSGLTFTGSQLVLPGGSTTLPSLNFIGANSNTGIYSRGSNIIDFTVNGAGLVEMTNGLVRTDPSTVWVWGSTSFQSAPDTGISRHATAGIVDIGNGTAQSTAGGIQTGNATLVSLTTGTNADFLCLNAGGGILIQSTACTISSLRFKPDWKPYQSDALAKVAKLDVGTFHLNTGSNADPNAASLQAGLSAESVAAIAPECAIYENDMKTPKSYRQECVIALLVKAIQELRK